MQTQICNPLAPNLFSHMIPKVSDEQKFTTNSSQTSNYIFVSKNKFDSSRQLVEPGRNSTYTSSGTKCLQIFLVWVIQKVAYGRTPWTNNLVNLPTLRTHKDTQFGSSDLLVWSRSKKQITKLTKNIDDKSHVHKYTFLYLVMTRFFNFLFLSCCFPSRISGYVVYIVHGTSTSRCDSPPEPCSWLSPFTLMTLQRKDMLVTQAEGGYHR